MNGIPVEAVQRVMEILGQKMDDANLMIKSRSNVIRTEGYGRKTELRGAIIMLEEVLAQYDSVQSRSNPDGRGEDDPTKQVEGQ